MTALKIYVGIVLFFLVIGLLNAMNRNSLQTGDAVEMIAIGGLLLFMVLVVILRVINWFRA